MTEKADPSKYLYRYFRSDRAYEALLDGELFFGSLSRQNDGFEGCAASLFHYSEAVAHELEVRRFVGLGGYSREAAEKLAASTDKSDKRENFRYLIGRLKPTLRELRQHSGVVCFSEDGFNQRMWDGYADQRRGVCIQFRRNDDSSGLLQLAKPVLYSNEIRQGLLLDCMNSAGALDLSKLADAIFFSKTKDWEGEREWRILMKASSVQTDESRKLKFSNSTIRRAFLGARMPPEDKQRFHRLSSIQGHRWSVIETAEDPDLGTITFEGIEIGRYPEDFDWHSAHGLKSGD